MSKKMQMLDTDVPLTTYNIVDALYNFMQDVTNDNLSQIIEEMVTFQLSKLESGLRDTIQESVVHSFVYYFICKITKMDNLELHQSLYESNLKILKNSFV